MCFVCWIIFVKFLKCKVKLMICLRTQFYFILLFLNTIPRIKYLPILDIQCEVMIYSPVQNVDTLVLSTPVTSLQLALLISCVAKLPPKSWQWLCASNHVFCWWKYWTWYAERKHIKILNPNYNNVKNVVQ